VHSLRRGATRRARGHCACARADRRPPGKRSAARHRTAQQHRLPQRPLEVAVHRHTWSPDERADVVDRLGSDATDVQEGDAVRFDVQPCPQVVCRIDAGGLKQLRQRLDRRELPLIADPEHSPGTLEGGQTDGWRGVGWWWRSSAASACPGEAHVSTRPASSSPDRECPRSTRSSPDWVHDPQCHAFPSEDARTGTELAVALSRGR
jgi:hypothetical protein